jgi:zinc/manganese transport system substrate-binding protein/manganese/iron transport system substrate-binding protein
MTRAIRAAVLLATVAAGSALLAGCAGGGPGGSPGASGTTIRVIATTTVFADIVRNVGGPCVDVGSIVPAGVGPEDYEPKPEDARHLADAKLIVSNGVGLDDFLGKLLASNASDAPRLVLGDGIPTIDVSGRPNPHFWLDPSLVRQYFVPAIARQLEALAPGCATIIQASAAGYAKQLDDLDAALKAKVATIPAPNRKLVTFHDAFPYFARHFGFELVGVIVANVGQDPTAAALASLVDTVKASGVRAVFSEAQFSPKLAQTLADEAGVKTVVSDVLTDALGPNGDTYLALMRWDMDRVAGALSAGQ